MPWFRVMPAGMLAAALVLKPDAPVDLGVDLSALAAMKPRQFKAMAAETAAIWRPYGVALTWIVLPAANPVDRSLTIVPEPPTNHAHRRDTPRLGSAVFLNGSVLAEPTLGLSVQEIDGLVADVLWANRPVADWPRSVREKLVGRALGRVLAHEIGHYLLAWRAHTADGLMRSDFRGDALVDPDRRMFRISPALLPRLNARLAQLRGSGSVVAETRQ